MRRVGICGIGQMGAAAAVVFERAGYDVLLWARDPLKLAALAPKLEEMHSYLGAQPGTAANKPGSLRLVDDLSDIDEESDLVMDAIGEVMAHKVELLRRFDGALKRHAIFITTTSGLSITEMGRLAGCGCRLAGAHFWNPPHLMPLVEVVRGEETEPKVLDTVCEIVRSIGKTPVRVNHDVPGFIGNRLLHALWREAINLVQRGIASPEDVDLVARLTFGLRLAAVGPLENMDLVGLDLVHAIHSYLLADLADDKRPLPLLDERVRDSQFGMKTGRGFYDWRQRDPAALLARRDRQIVRQLEFLKEIGAL
jgi:3-hydroxybutyryl-CoA dehydrogenase